MTLHIDMDNKKSKRVLLTRENNGELADILRAKGIDVLEIPLIKVELECNRDDTADILQELGSYNWITFSSVNGVRGFFKAFFEIYKDIRSIGIARLACVGESTSKELNKYYLQADVVPQVSTGMAMADAMAQYETLDNLKILSVCGNLSRENFAKKLEQEHHAIIDTFEVYKTSEAEVSKEQGADFRKYGADALVFASPSAVQSFAHNAPSLLMSTKAVRPKIVTIGSSTSDEVKKFGMKVDAEAVAPHAEALAQAVIDSLK